MVKRTKQEALKTRERILDAAVEVFHRRGVARPSLTDVAKLAGVTRGAVYGHFENKSALFTALCDRILLPLEAVCAEGRSCRKPEPLAQLRENWVSFLTDAARDEQQRKILTIIIHRSELLEESGAIVERLRRGRAEGMASMEAMIRQAVDGGQLPVDLNVGRAVLAFHAGVAGLITDWLFAPDTFDLAVDAGPCVDALIDMLASAPSLRG